MIDEHFASCRTPPPGLILAASLSLSEDMTCAQAIHSHSFPLDLPRTASSVPLSRRIGFGREQEHGLGERITASCRQ
jgi:hypothetical protein